MNLEQFDLNLLVALDALLTEKNVTHAGLRIHLSQSAMSGTLARLRSFFQDELLVTVGRKMALTPLAQSLVLPVRNILMQVQGAITTKSQFDPATSKRIFSLALSDYVTTVFIVDVLRNINRRAPKISFELRPIGDSAVEALESGSLDFIIQPNSFASDVHPRLSLFEDTHVCIAWTGNTRIGNTISIEEYLEQSHVVVRVSEGQSPTFEELFFRRLKYKRRAEVITYSFDVVPQLVVGTDRLAIVTTRLAAKYAKFLPLKLIPPPVEIPPLTEVLQWHKCHNHDPGYLWFRTELKNAAAKLPQDFFQPANGTHSPLQRSKARHSVVA